MDENNMKPSVSDGQKTDVLLVQDKRAGRVNVVKGVGADGSLQTVPPLQQHAREFMRVDNNSARLPISFPTFTGKSTTSKDWAFSGATFRWWNRMSKPSGQATNKVKYFECRNPISMSSLRISTASTGQRWTGRA